MDKVARWTTPTFSYKPSLVEAANIAEIYLVLKQSGQVILSKNMESATISDGTFFWDLSQEDTGAIRSGKELAVKIDYKDRFGKRYTTEPKLYTVDESGINEVI